MPSHYNQSQNNVRDQHRQIGGRNTGPIVNPSARPTSAPPTRTQAVPGGRTVNTRQRTAQQLPTVSSQTTAPGPQGPPPGGMINQVGQAVGGTMNPTGGRVPVRAGTDNVTQTNANEGPGPGLQEQLMQMFQGTMGENGQLNQNRFESGVPQFVPGANPFNPQSNVNQSTEDAVLGGLANPSRFGSDEAMNTFNRLNQSLTQGFGMEGQRINEEMARRGIFQSTIAGGRMGDLASNQANAQSNLASNIASEQARTFGQDRAQAINQALGLSNQQFGQAQSTFNTNQGAQQQNFDQRFNTFGANQGAQQQAFNQRQQNLNNVFGFGQQQFQNQLDTGRFNMQQDSQQFNQLMASLGMT